MSVKEIVIKKIVLQLGEKEVELSPDEAERLRKELNNLLGGTTQIINIPQYVPYYPHNYPYNWPRVWYGSIAGASTSLPETWQGYTSGSQQFQGGT